MATIGTRPWSSDPRERISQAHAIAGIPAVGRAGRTRSDVDSQRHAEFFRQGEERFERRIVRSPAVVLGRELGYCLVGAVLNPATDRGHRLLASRAYPEAIRGSQAPVERVVAADQGKDDPVVLHGLEGLGKQLLIRRCSVQTGHFGDRSRVLYADGIGVKMDVDDRTVRGSIRRGAAL